MITIKATGDTTLHTAGKYCEEDILVQVPEGGADLPELTNEGTATDLMLNKELIDADGNKITGTFTIENELTEQTDLISQITNLVATKATPSGTNTNDATATAGDILSGKTAYVKGSKVTGTIATKAAATYTPSTSNQTITSGIYLAGTQTIKGDANLKAENIASGVSIFGVTGTHAGGGTGGGGSVETTYLDIFCDAPAMDSCTATYTDANMQLTTKVFEIMSGTRIELAKGTIITLSPWTATDQCQGFCTKLFSDINGGAYIISGDAAITYA